MTKSTERSLVSRFIHNNFPALTHRNYRYFWMGQCISLIGTWMQSIGQTWLVFTLTNSPLLLGVFGAMQFLPVTVLSLFAGVFIDKFPKKRILIVTQSVSMMLALILSLLVFTHTVQYGHLLALALLLGITNSIDMPTRQSFMIEIAGREDLMNAIALNSVVFNLAKILGPAIGAVVMAILGAGWCFLLNGLSFIAVIYGLLQIQVKPYVRQKMEINIMGEIKDGLRYIHGEKILLQTMFLTLVIGVFAFNYNVLIPVFVKNVLHAEAKTFGALMAALGIGSLLGALFVSKKGRTKTEIRTMVISSVLIGFLYVLTGFSVKYGIVLVLLVLIGAFSIFFSTTANTMLQTNSKDEFRGRVMSVHSLVFAGATPLGSLMSGTIVSIVGVSHTFIYSGIFILFLTLLIPLIFRNKRKQRELRNKKTSQESAM